MRAVFLQVLGACLFLIATVAIFGAVVILRDVLQAPIAPSPHLAEDPPILGFVPLVLIVLGILAILLGRASWRASESRPSNGDVPPE